MLVLHLDQTQEQWTLDNSELKSRRQAKDKILVLIDLKRIRLGQCSRLT
jgi:hypothetical protein